MTAGDFEAGALSDPERGATVVLIHGALCDSRVWEPQLAALAKAGWRAVALELEGYHPDSFELERFSADRHVKSIGAFLRGLDRPAHLVGHSRGARISLAVAANFPEALASLTLLEPGGVREPDFFGPTSSSENKQSSPLGPALEHLDRGDGDAALRTYIDAGHGEGAWARCPELFRRAALENVSTMRAMAVDASHPLSRAYARRVTCPTLLIEGGVSPVDFHRIDDVLEQEIADVRRVRIEGADHFLPMTHAEAVNAAMMGFIAQVASEGSPT